MTDRRGQATQYEQRPGIRPGVASLAQPRSGLACGSPRSAPDKTRRALFHEGGAAFLVVGAVEADLA
jgi:hypothetical protein